MNRARKPKPAGLFDPEARDLPPEMRWREWMGRVEAVIFASPTPVDREALARIVGKDCKIEALIDDIRTELRGRPYDLVAVAGGWQHRTKVAFGDAIRFAKGTAGKAVDLSPQEMLVLTAIAYFQPIERSDLSNIFGREISRDLLGDLRAFKLIKYGPRSPRAGSPFTFVTTAEFLSRFGYNSLRELPEMSTLEEAGMLSKKSLLCGELHQLFGVPDEQ